MVSTTKLHEPILIKIFGMLFVAIIQLLIWFILLSVGFALFSVSSSDIGKVVKIINLAGGFNIPLIFSIFLYRRIPYLYCANGCGGCCY